ncbi:SNF2 family N-terminal domain-containing protein [Plectosphaerella plurivora]|uniref:SNF2 family N-terminal domain-containing protein n=1 Tax=Plectosphaerella plurivora TaxID=936078 RepID=A0A9P9A9G0_9PEZI|nr:SNF2 family N-terminal domain-containing protein [Plectosphaerella plurivora]
MNTQQQRPDEAEGIDNTAAHEVPPNEPSAKKKRKTVIKYPCGKDAREQAAVRQLKKHNRLKEHIRKLMQKQGPDLAAEDVCPPPPIRRRNVKIQASDHDESEDSEGSIDPDTSEPEVHDIKAKDRIKEINARIISGGLTNRRTGSQKADLEEARLVFGKGKVKKIKRRGEVFCQLSGMTVELKEFQLVGAGWMVKRETDEGHFKGGLLADVPGFGKTVMSLAAIAGNPPSPDQTAKDIEATLIVVPNGEILKQWMGQIQQHMEFANRGCFAYKGSQNGNMTAKELSNRKIVLTTYQEVQRAWPSAKRRQELQRECTTTTTTEDGTTITEFDKESFDQLCWEASGLLFQVGWYRVIFDEVHSVKNVNSQTCVAAQNLQYTIFWGLSGTPLVNADTEMFPYLRLINWTDVETLADYREKYLKDVNGRDRIDALVSLLTFRRTHEDRFLGQEMIAIPKADTGTQWVNLTDEERVVYDLTTELFQNADEKNGAMMRLRQRQAVSHPFLLESFFRTSVDTGVVQHYVKRLVKVENQKKAHEQIGSWDERKFPGRRAPKCDDGTKSSALVPFGKSDFGGKFHLSPLLEVVQNTKTLQTSQCPICRKGNGQFSDPRLIEKCNHICCDACISKHWLKQVGQRKKPRCPECYTEYAGNAHEPLPEFPVFRRYQQLTKTTGGAPKQSRGKKNKNPLAEAPNRRPGDDYFGVQPAFRDEDGGFWDQVVLEDLFGNGGIPTPSAKTTAVKDIVLRWLQEDPGHKGIIFTQFVTTALVIGRMLQLEGINFAYLNGKVTSSEKQRALKGFEELDQVPYLIASMKCGGQSLNLMFASRTIMCDTWWNKAAEEQAFGRVFRFGQEKTTHNIRILARDTVDEDIEEMQDYKDTAIKHTMHDDGHETTVHSEYEIMKVLLPEKYLAWVQQCIVEILEEDGLMPEPMDVDCLALLDLKKEYVIPNKPSHIDLETEHPDEPRPPSDPYGPQDIGREY